MKAINWPNIIRMAGSFFVIFGFTLFYKTCIWNIPRAGMQCKENIFVSPYIKAFIFNCCSTLKLNPFCLPLLKKDLQNTDFNYSRSTNQKQPETAHTRWPKICMMECKDITVLVGEPITTGNLGLLRDFSHQSAVNGEGDMCEKWGRFKLQTRVPWGSGITF